MSQRKKKDGPVAAAPQSAQKPYKLFAINYYGTALNSIKDEFYKQVQTGIRRRVIIIDLEHELRELEKRTTDTRLSKYIKKDTTTAAEDLLRILRTCMDKYRRDYEAATAAITQERNFNLMTYWTKEIEAQTSNKVQKNKSRQSKGELEKIPEKGKPGKNERKPLTGVAEKEQNFTPICPVLVPKEHNRIGRPKPISKIKYIEDEPSTCKLYFIIMGKLDNDFYLELLRKGEPLQAVVHFVPEPCAYDYLVPNAETQTFLIRTMELIQRNNYEFRKDPLSKPSGILKHGLPVISRCLALKRGAEIYDQLCWFIYDIETVFNQYQQYYIQPFQVTDVSMPSNVDVEELFNVAESLGMQGHYLNSPVSAVSTDTIVIMVYMEGLLNTLGEPSNLLNEQQVRLMSNPMSRTTFAKHGMSVADLSEIYTNAFSSITKLKQIGRLFVEANNRLLTSLIRYQTKHNDFRNIYLACMEYFLLQKYTSTCHIKELIKFRPYSRDKEPMYLPKFVKFYSTKDGVLQRLRTLFANYDDYDVDEIFPQHKLYHFRRIYNEIFEESKVLLLPSRLCFRDFTVYQMEEFLKNLVTPNMRATIRSGRMTSEQRIRLEFEKLNIVIDDNVFIRLCSLKACKLKEQQALLMFPPAGDKTAATDKAKKKESARTSAVPPPTPRPQEKGRSSRLSKVSRQSRLSKADDYVGLPENHPLLKGYNLEDIRQEIFVHTSKYYFKEGMLEYYDERWCFMDMNKFMHIMIYCTSMHFVCPRGRSKTTAPNVRICTNNDICIRVWNSAHECAKIVMNYPNGLSVFYHENYAEQIWNQSETHNHEKRRLFTPYGAVIVFYKEEDMILVMRYNGEVYKLYQYEFDLHGEEEEEDEMEMTEEGHDDNETFDDATQQASSRVKEQSSAPTSKRLKSGKQSPEAKPSVKEDKTGRASEGKTSAKSGKPAPASETQFSRTKSKGNVTKITSPETNKLSSSLNTVPSSSIQDIVMKSIEEELKFLDFLSVKYDLSYVHLILTTSVGRNIVLTHEDIFETGTLWTLEWHDYFANESYAMRADGVKMIWTAESLKCFHADGTVITTKTNEIYEPYEFTDEFESLITPSSSHQGSAEDEQILKQKSDKQPYKIESIFVIPENIQKPKKFVRSLPRHTHKHYLTNEGEEESGVEEDRGYINYGIESFYMQHICYAAVRILLMQNIVLIDDALIFMEIYGIDEIRIHISAEVIYDSELFNVTPNENEKRATATSTHVAEDTQPQSERSSKETTIRLAVRVWVSPFLDLCINEEDCTINTTLKRDDDAKGPIRANLQLKFDYNANLTSLFHEFVSSIAELKNYKGPKMVDLYFIEKKNKICHTQGFEFYDELPKVKKYTYVAGNTVTELEEVQTIDKRMHNNYERIEQDLKKFPRFRQRKREKTQPIDTFPKILTANVFVEIPYRLANTEDIRKFTDPFDTITYKKLRKQILEAIDFYIRPWIRTKLQRWASKISWHRRHLQHARRIFKEQQRSGLYQAMLNHKIYPKYRQFVDDFHGRAKYIDFFVFMVQRCNIDEKIESGRKSPKGIIERSSKTLAPPK